MRRFYPLFLAALLVLGGYVVTPEFAQAKSRSYRSSSSSGSYGSSSGSSSYGSSSKSNSSTLGSSSVMWDRSSSRSKASSPSSISSNKFSTKLTSSTSILQNKQSTTTIKQVAVSQTSRNQAVAKTKATSQSNSNSSNSPSANSTASQHQSAASKGVIAQSLKRKFAGNTKLGSNRSDPKSVSTKYGTTAQLNSKGSTTNSVPKAAKSGVMDANVKKQKASQAFATHQANKQKFAKQSSATLTNADKYSANASIQRARHVGWSYDDYYTQRNLYYLSRSWTTPSYAYYSSPSFGAYDSYWLWMLIDSIEEAQYRNWSYHHRHEPSYLEWLQEANRLARDNAELRAKLNKLDQQMVQMESYGVKEDPNYVIHGVEPALMYAPELVTAPSDAEFVMGTGSVTGLYNKTCQKLSKQLTEYKVRCEENGGSIDNLEGLISGKYAGVMLQSNVLNQYLRKHNTKINSLQATVYPEVIFVLANRQSGIADFADIDPNKNTLYVAGGGALSVLEGFALQNKLYRKHLANYRKVTASQSSLQAVAANKDAAIMFVCGVNCPLIELANSNFGDQLTMVPITDWSFNDAKDQHGNSIFRFVQIPDKYPAIMDRVWLTKKKETLAVDALFVVSESWVKRAGMDNLLALETALWPVLDKMRNIAGLPAQ